MKDYEIEILYHPGKANVMADGLSRKSVTNLATLLTTQKRLLRDLEELQIEVRIQGKEKLLSHLTIQIPLYERIKEAQKRDVHIQQIRDNMEQGKAKEFQLDNDIVKYGARICVPDDETLKEEILREAHNTPYTAHRGSTKMYQDLRKNFWWNNMKREIVDYVHHCLICQQIKAEHQKPAGLLEPLPVPEWKWTHITTDFVMGLPRTKQGYDAIWVVVDRLTKVAHFLPIRSTYSMEKLAELYIKEIVRLHGVPMCIISDRDARFRSRFWTAFQRAMGTKLNFCTTAHPQTDGQSERTIQTLEDMLRACVLDFGGSWIDSLPLVEFAYNNSYQATIGMPPFEALYGRRCRTPICWEELGDRKIYGLELVDETTGWIKQIQKRILMAQSRQKSYADNRRRPLEFQVGDMVFLRVAPIKSVRRIGKRDKLGPRYIGPFEVTERIGLVAYRLKLPPEMAHIHDVFHVSMLKRFLPDPKHVISYSTKSFHSDLTYEEQPVKILDYKEKFLRHRTIPLVKVLWRNQDIEEATWEPEEEMRKNYPHLF